MRRLSFGNGAGTLRRLHRVAFRARFVPRRRRCSKRSTHTVTDSKRGKLGQPRLTLARAVADGSLGEARQVLHDVAMQPALVGEGTEPVWVTLAKGMFEIREVVAFAALSRSRLSNDLSTRSRGSYATHARKRANMSLRFLRGPSPDAPVRASELVADAEALLRRNGRAFQGGHSVG